MYETSELLSDQSLLDIKASVVSLYQHYPDVDRLDLRNTRLHKLMLNSRLDQGSSACSTFIILPYHHLRFS